jgi:hypothetical protein
MGVSMQPAEAGSARQLFLNSAPPSVSSAPPMLNSTPPALNSTPPGLNSTPPSIGSMPPSLGSMHCRTFFRTDAFGRIIGAVRRCR